MKAGRKQIYDWASMKVGDSIDIEIGERDPKTLSASILGSAKYYRRKENYRRKERSFEVTSKTINGVIRVWRIG
jgi:hypothetical protein